MTEKIESNDFVVLVSRKGGLLCVLRAKSLQSCVTLCDLMDCSPPGSSDPGILHARTLEWVAMPSSRGSSWPREEPVSLTSPVLEAGSLPILPCRYTNLCLQKCMWLVTWQLYMYGNMDKDIRIPVVYRIEKRYHRQREEGIFWKEGCLRKKGQNLGVVC